jgi:hypothetical protein
VNLCHLPRDKYVVVASMMPKATAMSHGYSTLVVSGATVAIFWVARESLTTVDR